MPPCKCRRGATKEKAPPPIAGSNSRGEGAPKSPFASPTLVATPIAPPIVAPVATPIATPVAASAASKMPMPTPVAKRTAALPPRLARSMCLHCSKRIDKSSRLSKKGKAIPVGSTCMKLANKKCNYYALQHHDCEEVPAAFVEVVNSLLAERATALALEDEDEIAAAFTVLSACVKQYTRDVEASVHTANKQGFKHKPKTAVEVGLLVVGQLKLLNNTMRGIYDIIRSQHSLAPIDLAKDADNGGDEEVGEVEEDVYKGEMSDGGSAYANVEE